MSIGEKTKWQWIINVKLFHEATSALANNNYISLKNKIKATNTTIITTVRQEKTTGNRNFYQ